MSLHGFLHLFSCLLVELKASGWESSNCVCAMNSGVSVLRRVEESVVHWACFWLLLLEASVTLGFRKPQEVQSNRVKG